MNFIQALLIAVVMGLLLTENLGYGHIQISRPVFAGPIIGLIMGDLQTGLIVGGTVELMFMGVFPVGGSVPPNAQFAGMMSTVLAIASGGNPEVGIVLAYPIGVFAQFVLLLDYNINLFITHNAVRQVSAGKKNAVRNNLFACMLCMFATWSLSAFLGIYFGSAWVESLYGALPVWLRTGLSLAGGLMPAMGMAMLLKMMDLKKYWSFLLVGYVFSAYLGLNVLSLGLLGIGIAVSIYALSNSGSGSSKLEAAKKENALIDKGILSKVYWRSYLVGACLNYERYLGLGYCHAIMPALEKVYSDDELKNATLRHLEFYNTHPWMHNLILGVNIAMEEQRALGEPITEESISAIKAALMGPTAGFGDSFFKGVVVTIFGGFAASLAIAGNPIAPLVFIVPVLTIAVLVRYFGGKLGYSYGTQLIIKMKQSNIIDTFVKLSSIVGLFVTAGLITNYVRFALNVTFNLGGAEVVLNDTLNAVFPRILPYALVFVYYFLIKKYPKSGLYITLVLSFAIGILGALLGIM